LSATRAYRRGGRWVGASLALGGAVLVNVLVFCAAPLLHQRFSSHGETPVYELTTFMPIKPPAEEEPEPTPPPPPPKLETKVVRLDVSATDVTLVKPELTFEINPKLAVGPAVAPPGPGRFDMGQVDQLPMAYGRVPPEYPYLARRRGIEGAVKIRFLVDTQGRVMHLQVLAAEPKGVFEESVLRTVQRWRFKPGVKDGAPVETWVETAVRFTLDGK